MGDQSDRELPRLGEATSLRPPRSDNGPPWYQRAWLVGLSGLVVGLLIGFGLAWVLDDNDAVEEGNGDVVAMEDDRGERRPTGPSTTAPPITVSPACVEAMRSAQQSLTVLEQGVQGLRQFNVGDVDRMLTDLGDLRGKLTERVRECLEST